MISDLATTTITIESPSSTDAYEATTWTQVATGIRAHFSSPRGSANQVGGDQELIDMQLLADPCTIKPSYRVTDVTTSEVWSVIWVRSRTGFELDHVTAGVRRVTGKANS